MKKLARKGLWWTDEEVEILSENGENVQLKIYQDS